jgi:hypothetical protein
VEGPACKTIKAQGLLIKIARAAPWISDPTATDARVRRGPHRAPGARVHGGPPPFKRRGTRSWPFARDRTAQDACKRWAAAASPESGGERWELAGVGPGRRSRPPLRPRAGAKRSAGACARDQGVKGGDRASPAAGTGRGRRGCSGELVEALLCVKGREIGQGLLLTVKRWSGRARRRRGSNGGGAWQRRQDGRRSGVDEARHPRAPRTRTCSQLSLMSPW